MASRNALDSPDAYVVAWIAALSIERASAEAMLDEEHAAPSGFTRHQTDVNVYTWGRMGEHNVVIVSLPAGSHGTTSAATTASNLLASLPSIRVGLLVGIGGGIARPDQDHDIRLGDVVVSQPNGATGGVFQHDLIKAKSGDIREFKGFLGRPPTVFLNALASIQAEHERNDSKGFDNDRLFKASSSHVPGPDCRGCDAADEFHRDPRESTEPEIHYGIIASGNTLIKDAAARDRILTEVGEDCICFEMEAAGLMNHFPCLVIRGICDYADSHKNDQWQRYASATAAAYAKELLAYVPAADVKETKKALEVLRLDRISRNVEYALTETVQEQIDGVQRTMVATKAAADSVESYLRADKIKSWLCPPDPSVKANHARKLRHEGTGTWLLNHMAFRSWLSGSCRHLWLHGLVGCGKTVHSATVLDHLGKGSGRLVLSFFFDFSDGTQQTVDGMLRSLAFQFYQSGSRFAGLLESLFLAHQNGRDQPTTSTLEDVVLEMLAIHKKTYIVLDALDESTAWDEVLQWMENVVSRPELGDVQLICTSRPGSEFLRGIPRLFGKENCLPLDKQAVNADIRSWVTAQLSQRPDFQEKRLSQDILERILKTVGDEADGMFRWAFCQLDALARCRHEAALEMALASLPMNLSETYRRMIENIPRELAHDAIRLLQFLVHCERPLALIDAREIIATQIETESPGFDIKRRLFCETDVLDYCPGLVTVVDVADRYKELHLAHFSVKEYLLGEDQFKVTAASIPITKTCLTYLTDINPGHGRVLRDFPWAKRAARIWTRCAVFAQDSEATVRATVRFLEEEATFQRWARLYESDMMTVVFDIGSSDTKTELYFDNESSDRHSDIESDMYSDNESDMYPDIDPGCAQDSRLCYACRFGLAATVRGLIGNAACVNAQDGEPGNALWDALRKGHQEIIELLLDNGPDINAKDGTYTALYAAIYRGHQEIQLLLSNGVDFRAVDGTHRIALNTAIYTGYHEIAKMFIDKGANINAQVTAFGSALQTASWNGHQEIVRMLLSKGADANAQDGLFGSALQGASCGGFRRIVRMLLAKGADVNAQAGLYGNALQAASGSGHEGIVQLLLDKGADVNTQGGQGDTYGNALQTASERGYERIVQLLLDKGADVNTQGGQGRTYSNAFQAALWNHLINAQGGQGCIYGNALQAASGSGHEGIVQMLLAKGADVNAQGGQGCTYGNALQAASERGHERIVQLLLDKGAKAI